MKRLVNIVFGPPGTGKTTRLLDEVAACLDAGIAPDRIGYVSFSRKAARHAAELAGTRFNLPKDSFPWFRTLHSVAYKLLGLTPNDIMKGKHYRELGEYAGYDFDIHVDENTEHLPQLDWRRNGDRCLHIYALTRARMTSLEEEWRRIAYHDLSLDVVKTFAAMFNQYKTANALVDFTDMLDRCEKPLPVEVLFIDEAQDLTAQQWSFARRIAAGCSSVWIAGDDDQAIYRFNGAAATTLLSLNGNRIFLRQSYRLPRTIHTLAHNIIKHVRSRVDKAFEPRTALGEITHVSSRDQIDLSSGTWLLLSRCRYGIDEWAEVARNQNVVYYSNAEWSNRTPAVRSVVAWEATRRNAKVSPWDKAHLKRYLKPGATAEQDWMSALELSGGEREYIRGLRRREESLVNPGRVVISTIHEAKGGEADNVGLMLDTNRRVASNSLTVDGADDERRVLYVGLTRAMNSLHLLRPQRRFHYSV